MMHMCDTCNKLFASGHALRRHVKEVHVVAAVHQCYECKKTFKRRYNFTRHLRNAHLMDIPTRGQGQEERMDCASAQDSMVQRAAAAQPPFGVTTVRQADGTERHISPQEVARHLLGITNDLRNLIATLQPLLKCSAEATRPRPFYGESKKLFFYCFFWRSLKKFF